MNIFNRSLKVIKSRFFSGAKKKAKTDHKDSPGNENKVGAGTSSSANRHSRPNRQPQNPKAHSTERQQHRSRKQRPPRKKSWDKSQFKVEPLEGKKRFHDLNLPNSIMHAVADLDFQYCTPIQAEILEETINGRDANGRAQTGTGKTAVFLITIFSRLLRNRIRGKREHGTPRALILAPTRELVLQIAKDGRDLAKYTPIHIQTIFGGMHYKRQKETLMRKTADVIVATPGRLLDFCGQKILNLGKVEVLVIDEADRMLDMGFIPDVKKIIRKLPHREKRQTMMFSATLNDDVERLSYSWTENPVVVNIEPDTMAADSVNQILYTVTVKDKFALLYNIIARQNLQRVLVFCNRRDETRRLAKQFSGYDIKCSILSGDVPQRKRIRTLEDFKSGKIPVLIATDVAGRGIHIEDMDHVINYTLPQDPEDYVHRIGRTGRAGETGTSISFACEEGAFQLPAIIDYLGHELPSTEPDEEWLKLPPVEKKPSSHTKPRQTSSQKRDSKRPRRPKQSRGKNDNRENQLVTIPPKTENQNSDETPKTPQYGKRNQRRKISPR